MKRLYRNLLMMATVLLCTVCFAVGLAACGHGNQPHKHTYSKTWETDATYHWHEPTCGDTAVLKDKAEHKYGTDNKCTVCGYLMGSKHNYSDWLSEDEMHYKLDLCHNNVRVFEDAHELGENSNICKICGFAITGHYHSYGDWTWDTENHWRPSTCGDTDEPFGLGAHVDNNNDDVCDICPFLITHKHTETNLWTYDETKHWKNPTCHPNVALEERAHSFEDGVCQCGVKQIEVEVYKIYSEREGEKAEGFAQWLASLSADGVKVRIVESGDVYYDYSDGKSEIKYFAERTVQVKTVCGDSPLADVWVMMSFYNEDDKTYEMVDGTIALSLAKTDGNGLARLTFIPAFGYSGNYRIRTAVAYDVANHEGIDEAEVKPIPDRYVVKADSIYIPYEVSENVNDETVTMEFSFSAGWNGIEKFTLPYRRYYSNPIDAIGLTDGGNTYTFTASGDSLFDYFYFAPYHIPAGYAPYQHPKEQAVKILENSYAAASGNYKIYFTFEGTANVSLYFWDENGVHLGGVHNTKGDGTPSDIYITSVSGGTAGNGKYTGGNFVNVGVSPNKATRTFQFGLISDSEVTVTLTVEYESSYESNLQYQIVLDEDGSGSVDKVMLPQEETTPVGLMNVSAGLYKLNVYRSSGKHAGQITAWTDTDKDTKICAAEGYTTKQNALASSIYYNGIIRFTDDTTIIYIENNFSDILSTTITIEKYELPELKADELTSIPISTSKMTETYDIRLDPSVSGSYELTIDVYGSEAFGSSKINGGEKYPLTVKIGSSTFTLNMTNKSGSGTNGYVYTYSATVTVGENDNTLSIVCQTNYALIGRVLLKTA